MSAGPDRRRRSWEAPGDYPYGYPRCTERNALHRYRTARIVECWGASGRNGTHDLALEDRWSDIDLAFGIAEASELQSVLADWTAEMYTQHAALHHFDVLSGGWVYRVFLLPSALQVDLAFAPAAEFGARAPTFRLLFGAAVDKPYRPPPTAEQLIGLAWLHALHARSCIARGRLWQAEYMVSGIRDHVLALACLCQGLPASHGRGMDVPRNDRVSSSTSSRRTMAPSSGPVTSAGSRDRPPASRDRNRR